MNTMDSVCDTSATSAISEINETTEPRGASYYAVVGVTWSRFSGGWLPYVMHMSKSLDEARSYFEQNRRKVIHCRLEHSIFRGRTTSPHVTVIEQHGKDPGLLIEPREDGRRWMIDYEQAMRVMECEGVSIVVMLGDAIKQCRSDEEEYRRLREDVIHRRPLTTRQAWLLRNSFRLVPCP